MTVLLILYVVMFMINNPNANQIYYLRIKSQFKHVMFIWIPCYIAIKGNIFVDQKARGVLDNTTSSLSIPYTDFKSFIMKYIL